MHEEQTTFEKSRTERQDRERGRGRGSWAKTAIYTCEAEPGRLDVQHLADVSSAHFSLSDSFSDYGGV